MVVQLGNFSFSLPDIVPETFCLFFFSLCLLIVEGELMFFLLTLLSQFPMLCLDLLIFNQQGGKTVSFVDL